MPEMGNDEMIGDELIGDPPPLYRYGRDCPRCSLGGGRASQIRMMIRRPSRELCGESVRHVDCIRKARADLARSSLLRASLNSSAAYVVRVCASWPRSLPLESVILSVP